MNNSAMRIEWDIDSRKQIEDAKDHYRDAKKAGRLITDLDDNIVEFFRPNLGGFIIKETELKQNEFSVRVFDETGDRRLIWDASDLDQIKEAMKLFEDYLAKGWRAYAVDETGKTRRRIHSFNIATQEVLFEDKPLKQIAADFVAHVKKTSEAARVLSKDNFENFVKSFKKTELIPRTYPG